MHAHHSTCCMQRARGSHYLILSLSLYFAFELSSFCPLPSFSPLLPSSLLYTLHTPRTDAAAKQQHVQALTTSLEKVVRLREKMSTAEVLLEALCANAYVAFMQAHACWCARFLYEISRAAQCEHKPNGSHCSNLHKCAQTHLAELQRQEAEASARLRAGQPLDPSPQSDRDPATEGDPAVNQGESRSRVQVGKDPANESALQDVLKGILETVQATEERSALLHQRLLDKQLPTDQGLVAAPPSNIAGGDRLTGVPVGNRDAVGISRREERYYDQRGREDWNSGREGSFEADERLTSQLDSAVPLSESTRAHLRARPREEADSAYLRTQEGAWNQHTLRREEKDRGRRVRQDGITRDEEEFRRTSYSRYAPYSSPSPPGRYRSSLPSPDPFPLYSFPETQQGDVPRDVPRGRKGRKEKQTRTKTEGKRTVRDLLAAVGLLAFEDMLVRNGWDSVQRIKMLAEDDLV